MHENEYLDYSGTQELISYIKKDISGAQTLTGNPITITDAAGINAEALKVEFSPKQDLHGYDFPWVGGAGKNKLQITISSQTINGITFTKNSDESVHITGTSTTDFAAEIGSVEFSEQTGIIYNGISGGTPSTYSINIYAGVYGSDVYEGDSSVHYVSGTVIYYFVVRAANVQIDTTIYPMIRFSTETDPTFAPYSNICPITGYTEVGVEDVGKNFCGELEIGTFAESSQIGSTYDEMKIANGARIRSKGLIPTFNNDIVISCDFANYQYCFCLYDADKKYLGEIAGFGSWKSAPYIPVTPSSFIAIVLKRNDGAIITNDDLENCHLQVEKGTTATPYKPFISRTASVTFGQTVYGGSVDVTDGGTSSKYDRCDLGDLTWGLLNGVFYGNLPSNAKPLFEGYCEGYKETYKAYSQLLEGEWTSNSGQGMAIWVKNSNYSDVNTFKTAMSGIKLVYQKATPTTLATPKTDLKLLQGTNNLTTNGTTITLKYQPNNALGQVLGEAYKYTDEKTTGSSTDDCMHKGVDYVTAGQLNGSSKGAKATIEGEDNTASGNYSHAEGHYTYAIGNFAHAEGGATTATEGCHAEGYGTCAIGQYYAHAEGDGTVSAGHASHAEGEETCALNNGTHTEGYFTTAEGEYAHAEGYKTSAYGNGAHAEGGYTTVANEGGTFATGENSHAEGYKTYAVDYFAHAEGTRTCAKYCCHAEGWGSTANGAYSHAEGCDTYATDASHAEGNETVANATSAHSEGYKTTASNFSSHAGGHFNAVMTTGGSDDNQIGTAFVIGNGTSSSALSNAFSIQYDGTVHAAGAQVHPAADYAEFFEWIDGNVRDVDRVGYFVTTDKTDPTKITLAEAEDDYVLGIVSGAPCVIGNGDCDVWNGMTLKDEFGRVIYEEPGVPKYNPKYDPSQPYISRMNRKEWAAVGMLGVLPVRDDGTCQVGGFCTVGTRGIATKADKYDKNSNCYKVIERINSKVIKVIFK